MESVGGCGIGAEQAERVQQAGARQPVPGTREHRPHVAQGEGGGDAGQQGQDAAHVCGRDRRPMVHGDRPRDRAGAAGAQRRHPRPAVAAGCDDVGLGAGVGRGRERPVHPRCRHRQGVAGVGRGAHRGAVVAHGAHHDGARFGDAAQDVLQELVGGPRQGVREAEIDDVRRPARDAAGVVLQPGGVQQALCDVVARRATGRHHADRHDRHPRAAPRPPHAGQAHAVVGLRGDDAGHRRPVPGAAGRGIRGVGIDAVAVGGGLRVANEVVAGRGVQVGQQVRVRDVAGVQHRHHHRLRLRQHVRRERLPHFRQPHPAQRPLAVARTPASDGGSSGGITRIAGNGRPSRQRRDDCRGGRLQVEPGHARGAHADGQGVASGRQRTRRPVGRGIRIKAPIRPAVQGHLDGGHPRCVAAPLPERRVRVVAQQRGPVHRHAQHRRLLARREQHRDDGTGKHGRNPRHGKDHGAHHGTLPHGTLPHGTRLRRLNRDISLHDRSILYADCRPSSTITAVP